MRGMSLNGLLIRSCFALVLLTVLPVAWFAVDGIVDSHRKQVVRDLEQGAILLGDRIRDLLDEGRNSEIDDLVKQLGGQVWSRFTIILPNGVVVGDSRQDPAKMDNHGDRPEIAKALSGETGIAEGHSRTLQKDMLYVAIPVWKDGHLLGVIRSATSLRDMNDSLNPLIKRFHAFCGLWAVLVIVLGSTLSRRVSRPLKQLRKSAERLGKDDGEHKLPSGGTKEMVTVAEEINSMVGRLNNSIRALAEENKELQAVLSSMVESVLAVDAQERILNMNQAAADFLSVNVEQVKGRTLQEITRNPELQAFVSETLHSDEPMERELTHHDARDVILQAHGTRLQNPQGRNLGAVIVLDDVTRLKQLENIRKDFVANVSHELRTPLTSIKGFVETLLGQPIENPEDNKRFLEIISRQTNRLIAIIDDLLALSRIEQDSQGVGIRKEKAEVCRVLRSAVEICHVRAEQKNVQVAVNCSESLIASINPHLIEQAVVNLVDNAIKYSEEGSQVIVNGLRGEAGNVIVSVTDTGCGITEEHLARIFERFYRVDKARSRKLGGTGLGLAIVKHIANAHGGTVSVESERGKGSTFSIIVPSDV